MSNSEMIFQWPNPADPVFSVDSKGRIYYYEKLSIMDYENIMKDMAKGLAEYQRHLNNLVNRIEERL